MWILLLKSTTLFICALIAEGQDDGDLRLVGGNNPEEGRLEIYHSFTWGTICDDSFGTPDAIVACRQLGYRTPTATFYTEGGGTDPIWLDNMGCDGTERKIYQCSHPGWTSHNCGHDEDVGINCTGNYQTVISPIFPTVKGNWGSWTSWTTCSATCDSGFKTKNRLCNNPVPSSNGLYCNGKSFELLECSTARCRVNGNWGSWSGWTTCSASCDSGLKTRKRLCNNPVPSSSGSYCYGETFEVLKCSTARCRVNGNWGHCQAGQRVVLVVILALKTESLLNNPVPSSSGSYCYGETFEVLKCSTARCRVDGIWGSWNLWSVCNATCGGGVKKRTRYCNNPCPSAGGSTCSGMAKETLLCAENNCPVNGDWSVWQVWSVCSSSCGVGIKRRTRLCDNPTPSYGGRLCNGNTLDVDSCNIHECPVDGDWSGWSSWNICSATCNGGIQDRNRKCDDPQPSNGGISCKGTPIESRPCHILDCEIDGQWGTWQEWEVCNTTCGNGTQQRLRKCDSPSPYFDGSECMGLDFDIKPCYQGICPAKRVYTKLGLTCNSWNWCRCLHCHYSCHNVYIFICISQIQTREKNAEWEQH
ncbi:Hypothetical predicted protein [Mytilus galloprovincialis]|uniref:SRCR domain-containing protein n=1 Tax=Mytilus galloprovincialis TaxID=29158 RepID=A0A8B6E8J1_MYTGA|nr:Hypothetical predicted protein [Mytilus galloprovincialis]